VPATILAWFNKRIAAIVTLVTRKLEVVHAVPYCLVYTLPAGYIPPFDFKTKAYPGLVAWHLVDEPSGPRLITYWQDKDSFDYTHGRFETAMGIASPVTAWGGAAGDLHAKEPAWWPVSLKEMFIAITTFVGVLTIFWNIGAFIVEKTLVSPKSQIWFTVPSVKISQGDPIKVVVNATNSTPFASVHLDATAQLIGSEGRQSVSLDPRDFQSVSPDATVTLNATSIAPSLKTAHSPAAVYKLSVSDNLETSRFGHTKTFSADLPVEVFPRSYGWTRQLKRIAQRDPGLYSAAGTLYTGDSPPAKLTGTVSVKASAASELRIDIQPPFTRIPKQPDPSAPAGGRRTILMLFDGPVLDKFQEYTFQITIDSSGSPPPEGWDVIEKNLIVTFQ
jgi:hypothetical protein